MNSQSLAPPVVSTPWLEWAAEELGGAGLGDARLDARLVQILGAFLGAPQESIPRSCRSWPEAKAAYRFFDNEKVKRGIIVERHREQVVKRSRGEPVLLAIGDTTQLDYTNHPETKGLGPLSDLFHHGMFVQPCLVVTPQRVPLGLIDLQIWIRDATEFGTGKETRKKRPIEEKESCKWLDSLQAAERLQQEIGDATQVVSVFDREGDIFEVLEAATAPWHKSRILVRAKNDRVLDSPQGHLRDCLEAQPIAVTVAINKPRKPGKEAREATLSIRFAEVSICPPADRPKSLGSAPIRAYAVLAKEDNPPTEDDAIDWMLITTVPVKTGEDAWQMVQWYACRWTIEVFFKVLKSGCEAEERQLETADRLMRCLAVDVIVAWRILYLTTVGRETPDLPCTTVFEDYEWKAIWVFVHRSRDNIPSEPPSLRDITRMIGRMGGHLGRKSDGEPGPLNMWRGLQRVPDISDMWMLWTRSD